MTGTYLSIVVVLVRVVVVVIHPVCPVCPGLGSSRELW